MVIYLEGFLWSEEKCDPPRKSRLGKESDTSCSRNLLMRDPRMEDGAADQAASREAPFFKQTPLMSISSFAQRLLLSENGLLLNKSDILVTSHV
jgi:hypothetical protein